jgi:hypothetical protein
MTVQVKLKALVGDYAISRLDRAALIPAWADGEGFVSIARTEDEVSVACLASRVPVGVQTDAGWRVLKFIGPFAFTETGIAAAVLNPLAEQAIGILLVSTFDTDYLLVKVADFERTQKALIEAGHIVQVEG